MIDKYFLISILKRKVFLICIQVPQACCFLPKYVLFFSKKIILAYW